MTPEQTAIYYRARAAGWRALDAIRYARWEPEVPATLDGFDIAVSDAPDQDATLDDLGYGRFLDGTEDWRTGYQVRPHPDAIRNPYRDTRNQSGGAEWYVPVSTLRESAAYYRKAGESRSVAWDHARAMVNDELRRVTWDYGPDVRVVTVTVSRNGIDLASDSVHGVEVAWDDVRRSSGEEYIAEVASDMLPDVMDTAREALAALVATALTPDAPLGSVTRAIDMHPTFA